MKGMMHDHAGRAEPVSRSQDLRTVNAELLRTAGKLIGP
jgi:hypothetical protein